MPYDQYGNWVDEERENMLAAQYAAPGLRSMRNVLQAETGKYYANPNVKRMTLREALRGYGEGISNILAGARNTARTQTNQEYMNIENKRQFEKNYELQEEELEQAGISSGIGAAGNLLTTAMLANAYRGKPLLSNPFWDAAGAGAVKGAAGTAGGGAAAQAATAAGTAAGAEAAAAATAGGGAAAGTGAAAGSSFWPAATSAATNAAYVYAIAKVLSNLNKTKEVPREISQAGEFVADLFEKPAGFLGSTVGAGLKGGANIVGSGVRKIKKFIKNPF